MILILKNFKFMVRPKVVISVLELSKKTTNGLRKLKSGGGNKE